MWVENEPNPKMARLLEKKELIAQPCPLSAK
jgi:hypothetical protein